MIMVKQLTKYLNRDCFISVFYVNFYRIDFMFVCQFNILNLFFHLMGEQQKVEFFRSSLGKSAHKDSNLTEKADKNEIFHSTA